MFPVGFSLFCSSREASICHLFCENRVKYGSEGDFVFCGDFYGGCRPPRPELLPFHPYALQGREGYEYGGTPAPVWCVGGRRPEFFVAFTPGANVCRRGSSTFQQLLTTFTTRQKHPYSFQHRERPTQAPQALTPIHNNSTPHKTGAKNHHESTRQRNGPNLRSPRQEYIHEASQLRVNKRRSTRRQGQLLTPRQISKPKSRSIHHTNTLPTHFQESKRKARQGALHAKRLP